MARFPVEEPVESGVPRFRGIIEEGLEDDASSLLCRFIPKASVLRPSCRAVQD